ncbi:NAD(P)/FAD-dependent oxidoreductase [Pseudoduganella sp. RAF53_2]|uniref:NAD(P)/FAD-dependent oxidoreductase n=1 Tax=unclassified Pseudoduganella TaxID=2637179 RepID=UPI003F965CE6
MLLQKELGVIENSFYEADVQRPAPLPPLSGSISADVCVIGGGLAGLSAALELAERGYSVVLLEAQRIGWGASGRNGGQVLPGFGSDGECAIERQLPKEDARRAWDASVAGIKLMHKRMQKYQIDCDYAPGALSLAVKPGKMRALEQWGKHVESVYGYPLHWITPKEMPHWICSKRFYAGVADAGGGHVQPLKYTLGLGRAALAAGVRIFEDSPVLRLERGAAPAAQTAQGQVSARFLVLAGNVYLAEYGRLAPRISARIMPVGTYIVATEPMSQARAEELLPRRSAVSDTNFVLDYFRLSADNRLLFGAGDSYSGKTPANLVERIRRRMVAVFPQLQDVPVQYAWGGFVDISMNRAPDIGRADPNIYYMQGFSGHGLAFTGMAGLLVAEAIAGQAERFDLFARVRHAEFPGGALLRTPALVLGMLYFQLKDML